MAKKRGRKPIKQNASSVENAVKEEAVIEKHENEFQDPEVERQSAAIRPLRDVEIEQLRTMLQLLRSYFGKEQLQVPLLQFFKENLPNLNIVKNEKGVFEVQQKSDEVNIYMNRAEGGNLHISLLHQLSMVYPNLSTAEPSRAGFSNKSVKTGFFGVDNLHIRGFDLEELSDAPIFERQDKFQTPYVSNQKLSIGVTPKTKRLPKHGEMVLSVRGSPLGVYKEDNIEAIDGSFSSKRLIGVKKVKLKKKMKEKFAHSMNDLNEKNKKLLDYLQKSNEDRQVALDIERQKLELEKRKLEFEEFREENKFMCMDLDQIKNPEYRAFIADRQKQIMQKKLQKY